MVLFYWILVNTITWSASYVIGLERSQLFNWIISGILVGLGQAILLRKSIPNLKMWFFATALSFAFGISVLGKAFMSVGLAIALFDSNRLSSFVSGGIFGIFNGCVMGIPVGFSQWLVLRRQVKHSSSWILVNFLGLTLGGTLGFIVVGLISKFIFNLVSTKWNIVLIMSIFGIINAMTNGVVTGVLICYLLKYKMQR
jgi:hypothetical protein